MPHDSPALVAGIDVARQAGENMSVGMAAEHARQLLASAISEGVAQTRGYRSFYGTGIDRVRLSEQGFAHRQIQPGLIIPTYTPTGRTILSLRPDDPRQLRGKVVKYEWPTGSTGLLDVHPFHRDTILDPTIPVCITEGIKKADAITSAGGIAYGLVGMWNFRGKNVKGGSTTLADFEDVAWNGREIRIIPDSDAWRNRHLYEAVARLKGLLERRGALVQLVVLPDLPEGKKQGADDFFAHGGTINNLLSIAQRSMPPEPLPEPVGAFHQTDAGNAQRFASESGGQLLWCDLLKCWYVYRNGVFERDDDRGVERYAHKIVEGMYADVAVATGNFRRQLADWALKSEGRARLLAMVEGAKALLGVSPDDLDAEPEVLNLRNCTLDLRTGNQRLQTPDDLLTKQAPYDFDPDAECPRWLKFLDLIFGGNIEMVNFIQRVIGYSLTGRPGNQYLFICYGIGANGKSTLLHILRCLLGDYAYHTRAETFQERRSDRQGFSLVPLRGARVVTASEPEGRYGWNEALIKELVGGDPITAAPKYGSEITFTPTFKPFVATNHRLTIKGQDVGIWRRIVNIEFGVIIPEQQRVEHYAEKHLEPELPGILNWALKGLREVERHGGIAMPNQVKAANARYRAEMDPLGEWLTARCDLKPGLRDTLKELYADYVTFCQQHDDPAIGKREWTRSLEERGCPTVRGNHNISYKSGISRMDGPKG